MTRPVAIRANDIGKRYRIGTRARHESLRDRLAELARNPFRRGKSTEPNIFWALSDVSFDIEQGDTVGLIGRNGAGKSTLLKILSRITEPTQGRIDVVGRIGSLLEVGTGFHPELTGRENIFLNGAILGMRRAEIARKFDEIVAFAEIDQFLDTPVRHYSSGMYTRLAFAVAAHLDPEILVIDEVLAVGDAAFQRKCLGRISDVASDGRTVIFVSHNMGAVNRICKTAIWLDRGRIVASGRTSEVVGRYLTVNSSEQGFYEWSGGFANDGVDDLRLLAVRILDQNGRITPTVDARVPFYVSIDYRIDVPLRHCRVGFLLSSSDGTRLFEGYDSDYAHDGYVPGLNGARTPGTYRIRCQIPGELLLSGRYSISVNAGVPGIRNLAYVENVLSLTVEDTRSVGEIAVPQEGVVKPKLKWELIQG